MTTPVVMVPAIVMAATTPVMMVPAIVMAIATAVMTDRKSVV